MKKKAEMGSRCELLILVETKRECANKYILSPHCLPSARSFSFPPFLIPFISAVNITCNRMTTVCPFITSVFTDDSASSFSVRPALGARTLFCSNRASVLMYLDLETLCAVCLAALAQHVTPTVQHLVQLASLSCVQTPAYA